MFQGRSFRNPLVGVALVAALSACSTDVGDDADAIAGAGSSASGSGDGGGAAASGSGGGAASDSGGSSSEQAEHDAGSAGPPGLRYSSADCKAVGAIVSDSPGDAGVVSEGCPNAMPLLGVIDDRNDDAAGSAVEGVLCCLPPPVIKCAAPGPNGDSPCFTLPKECGARAGQSCTAAEFCAYALGGLCGAADAVSLCKVRPASCTDIDQPVCGCDGTTYANACTANASGVGVNTLGVCPAP